jgi:serine/threonine protein kinase
MAKSFVVNSSGNLYLSQFEDMRIEDPNSPFRPIGGPAVGAMAFMAPELLDSLRGDGVASLSKATDIYALGCLGFQVWSFMLLRDDWFVSPILLCSSSPRASLSKSTQAFLATWRLPRLSSSLQWWTATSARRGSQERKISGTRLKRVGLLILRAGRVPLTFCDA